MDKLALAKKIGKVALKLGGLAGADDKTKRLEAEKELLELKLVVAVASLRELAIAADRVSVRVNRDAELDEAVSEAREALQIVDRME